MGKLRALNMLGQVFGGRERHLPVVGTVSD
jgi:hypothetical protein